VTVIDGATDSAIVDIQTGTWSYALCYNPLNNKVYCANSGGNSVAVVCGAADSVVTTVPVGDYPRAFCHNPQQNRVYVANYDGSSISVLRDSMSGIEESFRPRAMSFRPATTIVRGVLFLPLSHFTLHSSLFSLSGQKVMSLSPGANDVGGFSPGVYFVRERSAESDQRAVQKVVIQN
jgi:YVTN family beta-propeller protein